MVKLSNNEVRFVLDALEAVEAELDALERANDWFSSDSIDRIVSSQQILRDVLGIAETYDEEEDDGAAQQLSFELRFEE